MPFQSARPAQQPTSFSNYFLNGGLQRLDDPGDPSMPYGPPLWPMPNIPLWAQHPPTARITVGGRAHPQNGEGGVAPMPLQPQWPLQPWPEPKIDASWFEGGALGSDANTVAARRVSRAVRSPGGRREGPLTSLPEELLIPKTPLDWAMYVTGGPAIRLGAKALVLGLGAALQPSDAEAGPAGTLRRILGGAVDRSPRYPGIYKDPRLIAQEAARFAAPESPALKQLFGVNRDDLFEMSKRSGNQEPIISFPPGSRGSEHAQLVTNQENATRLVDAMSEVQKLYPDFYRGMVGWFSMDPAYQRLVQLLGKEEGGRRFDRMNIFSGLASPGSSVPLEFNRGLGAYYLHQRGRFGDFVEHGGVAQRNRGTDFPQDMTGIAGHLFHDTAHLTPMQKYVDTGALDMESVKVPLYIQSSGVPERGFQTQLPVPDVHFSGGIGLTDARPSMARSTTRAELQTISPWYNDEVASPLGLSPIQAEGLQWGTFGPQTGVRTKIGAPKLEIMANGIDDTARRIGIRPEQMRDMILLGERYPAYGNVPMTLETFSGR